MAQFFVGQRVRVKRNDNPACPCRVGAEGRIVGDTWSYEFEAEQWCVCVDGCEYWVTKYDADVYLEPILPDNQACDDDFKRDLDRLLERQGIAA